MNQRTGQTVTDNSWFNYPAASPSTVSYAKLPAHLMVAGPVFWKYSRPDIAVKEE